MMVNNDIFENDKLELYVKKDKVDEITNYYGKFKWEVVDRTENKKYEDLIDLTFSRPHYIKNKDDLQLLQVHLEENLNKIGKLEKMKNSKTLAFGLSAGILPIGLAVLGILQLINFISTLQLVGGMVLLASAVFLGVAVAICARRIHNSEYKLFVTSYNSVQKTIEGILLKVNELIVEE